MGGGATGTVLAGRGYFRGLPGPLFTGGNAASDENEEEGGSREAGGESGGVICCSDIY